MNVRTSSPPFETNDKQVEFVPPDNKAIEQFASDVCASLVQQGRMAFAADKVRWAIADFMKLIAEVSTNRLNKQQRSQRT